MRNSAEASLASSCIVANGGLKLLRRKVSEQGMEVRTRKHWLENDTSYFRMTIDPFQKDAGLIR